MLRSRWYTWYAIIPGTVARPERLPAGFARSSLAHRSGPPARLRAASNPAHGFAGLSNSRPPAAASGARLLDRSQGVSGLEPNRE